MFHRLFTNTPTANPFQFMTEANSSIEAPRFVRQVSSLNLLKASAVRPPSPEPNSRWKGVVVVRQLLYKLQIAKL